MTRAEEIAIDLALALKFKPSDEEMRVLREHNLAVIQIGFIFQPNDHLLEEMIKQAQEREPQKLP